MKFYPRNAILIAFLSLLTSGCAGVIAPDSERLGYPAQYRQALDDFAGHRNVNPESIERFVDFLANLGDPATGTTAASLYAEDLHFSDALMVTRDKKTVVDHFTRLSDAGTRVDVQIHQTLQSDADVYLIWSMQARFTPINKEVTSDTLGVTHVRFDITGQVILHQDFWDSGLGFYSHIPVLGAGVRAVGRRFAADKR
ncbi:MAG: hypothetical protein CMP86_14825 [Gammaproteobacteria bacterium]|nr:hypothetical protein [Gammaproteobacteria bacterium]